MSKFPKINSIHFGGPVIAVALIIGGAIPFVIWLICGEVVWWLVILGAAILALFGAILTIEMHQDHGKVPYYEKHLKETIPFDPEKQYAVIRASICTGEKVAGFKDKSTKAFTEVMLVRNAADEERFKEIYDIQDIKKEY